VLFPARRLHQYFEKAADAPEKAHARPAALDEKVTLEPARSEDRLR